MRKLNDLQKEMIAKQFPTLAYTIVKWVEKVGDEKNDLQDDIQYAKDIIREKR